MTAEPTTPAEHGTHGGARRYWVVWGVLMVLTALTILAGRAELRPGTHLVVALTIAVAKATLVALFFMHLWTSEGVNRLAFAVAILFVLLLTVGVLGDVGTRLRTALPPGSAAGR